MTTPIEPDWEEPESAQPTHLDDHLPLLIEFFQTQMVEVVLFTKPGCCLCDTVKAQLGKLRLEQAFELREVNILEDRAAYAKFHEEIPVVFIDGRKAFKFHLDEKAFVRRLHSRPAQGEKAEHGS